MSKSISQISGTRSVHAISGAQLRQGLALAGQTGIDYLRKEGEPSLKGDELESHFKSIGVLAALTLSTRGIRQPTRSQIKSRARELHDNTI